MIDGALLGKLRRINELYGIFSELIDPERLPTAEFRGDFHFSAKDNLCACGYQARAGSKILEGYMPPFDATAVRRMREGGGLLIGKTNMDEFGFGTFSTNSGYGIPKNPHDPERSCGGSSGGAAAAACLLQGHVALGVSTGGSISCPSSFCGVVGLAPTYGRVSRHGLVDYGNSLDKVGIMSRTARDLRRFLPVISGPDPRDPTSCSQPKLDLEDRKTSSIAVPKEAMEDVRGEVQETFERAVEILREEFGAKVREVSIPSLRFALPAYYILATSEASTNLARYCGMRFGVLEEDVDKHFNDFFSAIRSSHFGKEAKRRILLGTYSRMVGFRDRYYMKALSVRQAIIEEYMRVLKGFDLILTPTMPFIAPRFSEIEKMRLLDMYRADFLTVPPNLAGLPHISIPCGYSSSMPIGMQAVAKHWDEGRLISLAERWEGGFEYAFPEVRV